MPNYGKKECLAQAAMLLQKYESNTVKTNDRFRKDTINSLFYWLSIYTARQIGHAIDRYLGECAGMGIERRYMRRSYAFFDGREGVRGFFESYIDENTSIYNNGALQIQANDCLQSFQHSGCGGLKGVLNYCKYCTAIQG